MTYHELFLPFRPLTLSDPNAPDHFVTLQLLYNVGLILLAPVILPRHDEEQQTQVPPPQVPNSGWHLGSLQYSAVEPLLP